RAQRHPASSYRHRYCSQRRGDRSRLAGPHCCRGGASDAGGDTPRVLHLEWAEPVMCGGHWVPEMIDMAGGVNCFGNKEIGSFRLDWEAVVESQPEMIILMLCGYTAQRALEDLPIL